MAAVHQQNVSFESPSERQQKLERVDAVARHLLTFGVGLHQVGSKLYDSLTAPDTNACARLFRAGIGLRAPMSRSEASALANHAERHLRGPRDYAFEKHVLLGHLLDRLIQCAHDGAEELRRGGSAVTAVNLETKLMFALANARPRSDIVPPGLTMTQVELAILHVVGFFLGRADG